MRITHQFWHGFGVSTLHYDRPGLTMTRAMGDRDPFQPLGPRDGRCGALRTLGGTAELLRYAGDSVEPCVVEGTVL